MDNPDNNWHGWQLFLVGAVPSAFVWLFGAWQWVINRKDKIKGDDLSQQDRIRLDLNEQRKSLSADQNILFDRLRSEWERATRRIDALEDERNRAWDLVRYWYRYCESLLHQLRNNRFIAEGLARRSDPPIVLGPFLYGNDLPDMENPERPTPPPPGSQGQVPGMAPPSPLKEQQA